MWDNVHTHRTYVRTHFCLLTVLATTMQCTSHSYVYMFVRYCRLWLSPSPSQWQIEPFHASSYGLAMALLVAQLWAITTTKCISTRFRLFLSWEKNGMNIFTRSLLQYLLLYLEFAFLGGGAFLFHSDTYSLLFSPCWLFMPRKKLLLQSSAVNPSVPAWNRPG